jgi:hypothetical protein
MGGRLLGQSHQRWYDLRQGGAMIDTTCRRALWGIDAWRVIWGSCTTASPSQFFTAQSPAVPSSGALRVSSWVGLNHSSNYYPHSLQRDGEIPWAEDAAPPRSPRSLCRGGLTARHCCHGGNRSAEERNDPIFQYLDHNTRIRANRRNAFGGGSDYRGHRIPSSRSSVPAPPRVRSSPHGQANAWGIHGHQTPFRRVIGLSRDRP